jgi:hypothetical protein
MLISELFRYQNDSFQSDIFSSDIGITDVDFGCLILSIDVDAHLWFQALGNLSKRQLPQVDARNALLGLTVVTDDQFNIVVCSSKEAIQATGSNSRFEWNIGLNSQR